MRRIHGGTAVTPNNWCIPADMQGCASYCKSAPKYGFNKLLACVKVDGNQHLGEDIYSIWIYVNGRISESSRPDHSLSGVEEEDIEIP